jgi:calcium/calmodulin-dependent protein kinase (CaM kinase) II
MAEAESEAQEAVVTATSSLLIRMTQELLDSISNQNFPRYQALCHPSLTCFEPEACGNLIHGLRFHKHYFDLKPVSSLLV